MSRKQLAHDVQLLRLQVAELRADMARQRLRVSTLTKQLSERIDRVLPRDD